MRVCTRNLVVNLVSGPNLGKKDVVFGIWVSLFYLGWEVSWMLSFDGLYI